jgi:demethylmenaquinone methyltransferase/2-methoxy-6-polyprenyl-1,4-benzoquinol methylase
MLAIARERLPAGTQLVQASAESLPFEDAAFDALAVTYLLRYVDDPGATIAELARVVRPGGTVASLEFCVPRGAWHPLWRAYVGAVLPAAGRVISPAWHEVGGFLGSSIRGFWRRYPLERQLDMWRAAGIEHVQYRRLSLGGGIVVWGRRGG